MKTSTWTSLRSTMFNKKDRSSSKKNKAITNALSEKLNVNEEYKQAFRTNSYVEFTTTNKHNTSSLSPPPSSSLILSCLLEPDQEFVDTLMFQSCNDGSGHVHHRLIMDYFQASSEAFKTCQLLLQALHQTRINHAIASRLIKLGTRALMADNDSQDSNNNNGLVYGELLSSFSQLKNNFSILIHTQFLALHDSHSQLLQKLANKQSQTRRELRLKRTWKRATRAFLVISNAAVLVVLLVLALHSLVGIVAAPGLISCFVGLLKKKRRDCRKLVSLELVLRQMEIAARTTYITMNDLDTLSRMAVRLDGKVEHLRAVADMWMRSSRRREMLKEAVKEFIVEDDAIVEQTKELHQHIYLCFLTINRSRRLVLNEIMGNKDQNR